MASPFCSIPDAIEEIKAGRMVVVVDDEDRENEGDLVFAAEKVTPEAINFMATHGRGLICLAMTEEEVDRLQLPLQATENTSRHETPFTVTIDAKSGITTGISSYDRAHTIQTAIRPDCRPDELARPGHIFPLRARKGGVLARAGHTEASVDLARMAGLRPAGVLCEVLNPDGTMARVPDLEAYCEKHGLKMCSIADLIQYRRLVSKKVVCESKTTLQTMFGEFQLHLYRSPCDRKGHLALTRGGIGPERAGEVAPVQTEPVLCRVHSECLTGDAFGSLRCDCGDQLRGALEMIAERGRGVLLYMRQEGRGIGLENKIKAYALQDEGLDTVDANEALGFPPDLRDYGVGAQILYDLGIRELRLLTNNPRKVVGLEGYGLRVVDRVPIKVPANETNRFYLQTKRDRLGHHLGDLI